MQLLGLRTWELPLPPPCFSCPASNASVNANVSLFKLYPELTASRDFHCYLVSASSLSCSKPPCYCPSLFPLLFLAQVLLKYSQIMSLFCSEFTPGFPSQRKSQSSRPYGILSYLFSLSSSCTSHLAVLVCHIALCHVLTSAQDLCTSCSLSLECSPKYLHGQLPLFIHISECISQCHLREALPYYPT